MTSAVRAPLDSFEMRAKSFSAPSRSPCIALTEARITFAWTFISGGAPEATSLDASAMALL